MLFAQVDRLTTGDHDGVPQMLSVSTSCALNFSDSFAVFDAAPAVHAVVHLGRVVLHEASTLRTDGEDVAVELQDVAQEWDLHEFGAGTQFVLHVFPILFGDSFDLSGFGDTLRFKFRVDLSFLVDLVAFPATIHPPRPVINQHFGMSVGK